MSKETIRQCAKDVSVARSDLNMFAGVKALMESSLVSSDCFSSEARIVAICNSEIQKCLSRHDRAMARLERLAKVSPHGG